MRGARWREDAGVLHGRDADDGLSHRECRHAATIGELECGLSAADGGGMGESGAGRVERAAVSVGEHHFRKPGELLRYQLAISYDLGPTPAITPTLTLEIIPTRVRWTILRRTGMGFTTWRGMCGSGVGIGMGQYASGSQSDPRGSDFRPVCRLPPCDSGRQLGRRPRFGCRAALRGYGTYPPIGYNFSCLRFPLRPLRTAACQQLQFSRLAEQYVRDQVTRSE